MEAQEIAVRLGVAVLFGSLIGFERQRLQRMAGLRTNSLVAVDAAGFVAGHGTKFARLALPLSTSSDQ